MANEEEKEGVGLVTVVVVVVVAVAAVLFIGMPRGHPPNYGGSAIMSLRTYLSAQNMFHRSDYYGATKLVYANPKDGAGFADLYQVGHGVAPRGELLKLIAVSMADARPGGTPKMGHFFADIVKHADGTEFDFEIDCGLCAVPAKYMRTGREIFIVDVTGTIYAKDAALVYPGLRKGDPVPPVTVWPDVEKEDWRAVDY